MARSLRAALRGAQIDRASLPELRSYTREELIAHGYVRPNAGEPMTQLRTESARILLLDDAGRSEAARVIASNEESQRRPRRQRAA